MPAAFQGIFIVSPHCPFQRGPDVQRFIDRLAKCSAGRFFDLSIAAPEMVMEWPGLGRGRFCRHEHGPVRQRIAPAGPVGIEHTDDV